MPLIFCIPVNPLLTHPSYLQATVFLSSFSVCSTTKLYLEVTPPATLWVSIHPLGPYSVQRIGAAKAVSLTIGYNPGQVATPTQDTSMLALIMLGPGILWVCFAFIYPSLYSSMSSDCVYQKRWVWGWYTKTSVHAGLYICIHQKRWVLPLGWCSRLSPFSTSRCGNQDI